MELEELQSRMEHFRHLETRENSPEPPQKTYLSMERDEMIRYIEFLQERLDEEKRAREVSEKRFEEESAARREADKRVMALLDKHSKEMQSLLQKNQELQQSITDLTSTIRLSRKNRFASTSQKIHPESKKNEAPTRDEEREDHDGTPTSASTESPASNDHRHIIVN